MAKESNNLNFHQTFQPELVHMKRLLKICDTGEALTKEEISEITGIPTGKSSGKVEPHIAYLVHMGLINDVMKNKMHTLSLTKLGKEVMAQDPGFHENLTLWLCHSRLTSVTGAKLWCFVFKKLLNKYDSMSKFVFEYELEHEFKPTKMEKFYTPLCGSYEGLFANLDLLKLSKEENKLYITGLKTKRLVNEYFYLYAYALLHEWEKTCIDKETNLVQNEIVEDQLYDLGMASTFGLSTEDFNEIYSQLCDKGILKKNALISPVSVIKLSSSDSMIEKLYSMIY